MLLPSTILGATYCAVHIATRGGSFDRGEPILLPEGKTLAAKQLQEVTAVLSERQAEVAILLEDETLRCVN